MKKIIIALVVVLGLASCKKTQLSNCGMAIDHQIEVYPEGQVVYRLWIQSEASDIVKKVDVTPKMYIQGLEEGYVCLENVSPW